jgi:hypothetical protein
MASLDWLTASMVVYYLILFQKPMESMHSFHEQQGSGGREFVGRKKEGGKGGKGLTITKIGGHSTHRSNVASLLGADQYHPYATQ